MQQKVSNLMLAHKKRSHGVRKKLLAQSIARLSLPFMLHIQGHEMNHLENMTSLSSI